MSSATTILKKILKVIGWIVLSIFIILISIALLIQVPSIQQKLISYATSYISKKTHTRVEIGKISLEFPKSLSLQRIYLDDIQKDTLLYAGELSVNFSLTDLLHHKIHLKNITLGEASIHLTRKHTDSLFNYNFLLTAFSDTTAKANKNIKDTTKSKWAIQLDDIDLKNIALFYHDEYGGSSVDLSLSKLHLQMDKIDIAKKEFNIGELGIDKLITSVKLCKADQKLPNGESQSPPLLSANKVKISNSNITFIDSINEQSVSAKINKLSLKNLIADLSQEKISLDDITLNKSAIAYTKRDSVEKEPPSTKPVKKNHWAVVVKKIDLAENNISYNVSDKPFADSSFDGSHLQYEHLALQAEAFAYDVQETKVKIKHFSANDSKGFSIESFATNFKMNSHSIEAAQTKLKTKGSLIDASIQLGFSSLSSLKDSIQFMMVNADLKQLNIKTSDILYFSPKLSKQAFFKNTANITGVSGLIQGTVNNLTGKNVKIKTEDNTTVSTDFIIAGLPYSETAYFNLPNLKVSTNRRDIEMIAGRKVIPQSISLPENISLLINFKGLLKSFTTTVGIGSSYGSAHVFAIIDKQENFQGNITVNEFDLGQLLKNKKMFGPVSLEATTKGHGLNKNTITADIKASVPDIYLNQYTYKKLNIDGKITGQKFEGKIDLKDENAAFDFDGFVNLNKNQEEYKFKFDLQGADLKKLHLSDNDLRIGLLAVSDLKGNSASTLNGNAGITKIIIAHDDKKYILDSLLFATINEKGKSEFNVSSAVISLKYNGTFSPMDISKEMKKLLNNYFPLENDLKDTAVKQPQDFSFEIQLHNHPILSEVFFSQLKEFDPGLIYGSFNSETQELKVNAGLHKIIYGNTEIKDLSLTINSDKSALNYRLTSTNISNAQAKLENLLIEGKAADKTITTTISSINDQKEKKIQLTSYLTKNQDTYTFKLGNDFYLMNDKWDISKENYFSINKTGVLIHDLVMNKTESKISVVSVHDKFNDDIDIHIENLKLDEISKIIEKDTSIAKGTVDGHVLLKRINKTYGIIANAAINNLIVKDVPVGTLTLKAEDPTAEKFDIDVKLKGPDNNVSITGSFMPKDSLKSLNIDADINSLSLKTVQAFSMGKITEASGTASGKFTIRGSTKEPEILGSLLFNNATINAAALNTNLLLKHETVELKKDGVYLHSFTMLDPDGNPAVLDGNIKMNNFKDFQFNMDVNTNNFTLLNSNAKSNAVYYGRMIIDSKIKVTGNMDLPVVNARVKLKKGSNFTFAVPEKKLTTDKGEGVVDFDDSLALNPIITRDENKRAEKSEIKGLDISSIIEIDKDASLKLLLDPTSGDSLVVKGDAALSFALDPSGKMSLTGAYNLNDGSYLVALESVIKRKFRIAPGSTIIWNGDPLDANVSINAIYSVRAAPIDLVADQTSGLSEADQNGFKQRYPFDVYLKLRGELLHPDISFEIQLPPEEKGIMGGAVNAKLNMLNEDPSSLNKQVFALLVLGRFVQEDPLQTETNAASNAARTTVGKFLTAQLNQLGSKLVPGVELNFDVQSYDDYESGNAEGRTEVAVGVKKQLFDERLSVQVGGTVDVEGEKAKQNSTSDITSDVTLEYKVTKDGRYRLKGFRHNQYEGAIEGQLVETGAGVLYVRDFNRWKEFFHKPRKRKETENNKDAEINNK